MDLAFCHDGLPVFVVVFKGLQWPLFNAILWVGEGIEEQDGEDGKSRDQSKKTNHIEASGSLGQEGHFFDLTLNHGKQTRPEKNQQKIVVWSDVDC